LSDSQFSVGSVESRLRTRRISGSRDYLLFYEYFHGDIGAGLGASHQTGWTGVIARIIRLFAALSEDRLLRAGRQAVFVPESAEPVFT
jgi:hypothetical protein